jgi:hypothetical protein
MRLDLETLLKGKATEIKGKNYFATADYVEPFLERMSKVTDDFRVEVKLPDQITKTKEGNIDMDDITYNRVWIQAVLNNRKVYDNHCQVIGMVYGLDTRKPVVKFYLGGLNMACTNLCVFNPESLFEYEVKPETAINYKCVSSMLEETINIKVWLDKLHHTIFENTESNINEQLGKWIRNSMTSCYDTGFGKVKLATSTAIDAYKLLFENEKSSYFVGNNNTDMFNVYNAFTELISNDKGKDILNKAEKTLLLMDILELD